MKLTGTASNEKLSNLYNQMNEGILILTPEFQRNLVWNRKHKENFLETILKQYPFPEIYICEGKTDVKTKRSTSLVVDGQQRLDTIYKYIAGDLKVKNISTFENLSDKEKKDFLNYKVVVRDLGELSEEQIKDIFKRINSVRYALNAMEIHNALYEGEFISLAQEVAQNKILDKFEIFSENQLARMKNAEFILLVMSTIEAGGYFSRDSEVEELIKTFDDEYPKKNNMKKNILEVLDLIYDVDLSLDSIWFRKSSFFTLMVELLFYKKKKGSFPKAGDLRECLLKIEGLLEKHKSGDEQNNIYAKFYHYMYQGTASKVGRIARADVLRKHLY